MNEDDFKTSAKRIAVQFNMNDDHFIFCLTKELEIAYQRGQIEEVTDNLSKLRENGL